MNDKIKKDPDIVTAFDLNKSSIYKLKCLCKYFYYNITKKKSRNFWKRTFFRNIIEIFLYQYCIKCKNKNDISRKWLNSKKIRMFQGILKRDYLIKICHHLELIWNQGEKED